MNYLFYLGIIIPTVITIVLFLVFIYCWFLQKARKEVLTKRYDPHGKMRRLGIPMDPPSPPSYCRVGLGGDLFSDSSGEDNEAYDVSRSPSTEQNVRGRPMYRTYHDSGISAGLSLSPTQEGMEPSSSRGGLAYRSCPDSGISGFGVHTMQTSACVHHHTCRGCCQDTTGGENIQMQMMQQQQQQQLHMQQQQQPLPSSSFYQQEQQMVLHQAMLHHNTIQASVHPNHGVCYGDDTTHPQSPLHYNPPPFHPHPHPQALEMVAMGGNPNSSNSSGSGNNNSSSSSNNVRQPSASASNVNILPHIQEQPASCVMQRTNNMCCNHPSPEHLNDITTQQQQISPQHQNQSCCNCSNQTQQNRHHHHQQQQQQTHPQHPIQQMSIENLPQSPLSQTCSSHSLLGNAAVNPSDPTSPQGHVLQQANYVNADGSNQAIEASSAFRPKPFHHHNNQQQQQPTDTTNNFTTPITNQRQLYQPQATPQQQSLSSYPSTSQCPPTHSYRDSGVLEVSQPTPSNTNSSPSDRPDSQASTSSTTDSEDSGFRSSHCAVQHNTANTLNKHGNPLLKPLRRPKNHMKNRSSKSPGHPDHQNKRLSNGNSNHKNNTKGLPVNSTPLTTLNPQNLSSQHEDHHHNNDIMQTTSLHEMGESSVANTRAPPRVLHLNGQNMSPNHNNSRTLLQLSPTKENDWPLNNPANDNETKTKRLQQQQQQQQQQHHHHPQHQQQQQQPHFDMTDISTHLSWKYLQDMSAASSKSASSDGSNSSADDSHRVVSPLLRHAAPPEPPMDVFSYSVV